MMRTLALGLALMMATPAPAGTIYSLYAAGTLEVEFATKAPLAVNTPMGQIFSDLIDPTGPTFCAIKGFGPFGGLCIVRQDAIDLRASDSLHIEFAAGPPPVAVGTYDLVPGVFDFKTGYLGTWAHIGAPYPGGPGMALDTLVITESVPEPAFWILACSGGLFLFLWKLKNVVMK